MEHLNRDELVRLFKVARSHNPLHHVALLVGLLQSYVRNFSSQCCFGPK